MAQYIDSASQSKAEFIRYWLDNNLAANSRSFYVQSGYFSYAAIEPFEQILRNIIKKGGSVRFVLGSNDGSLDVKDVKAVFKIIKGRAGCSLTIVALTNAEFHPKCYYIGKDDGAESALVGSGNLTYKGTSLNIEAAIVLDTDDGDSLALVQEIRDAIEKWLGLGDSDGAYQIKAIQDINDLQQSKIIGLDNPDTRIAQRKKIKHQKNPKKVLKKSLKRHWHLARKPTSKSVGAKRRVASVLIAEIPKGSGRWKQANFDKENFEGFFGLIIGDKTRRVSLQHVAADGSLESIENRQGVSVKSHNYRLELDAASGLSYPTGSVPIAVFIRITPNTFRYRLFMPNDPHFQAVAAFLASNWTGIPGRKRRVLTDTAQLRKVWAKSPFWKKAGTLF